MTDPDADPFVEMMLLLVTLALGLALPFARVYAVLLVLSWGGYGPGPTFTPVLVGGLALSVAVTGFGYTPPDKSGAWHFGRAITIYVVMAVEVGIAALVLS